MRIQSIRLRAGLTAAFAAASIAFGGASVFAQQPTPRYRRDLPAELMKQAKVAEPEAAKSAVARVPNGQIQAVELENEDGRLIYSYEIKVPGRSGIEEVNVNAKTGEVVGSEHETPATEKQEAQKEKARTP
ncbi:MAG TPA: PepSY domain-containing protein [Gemmatimonadaceae bacterium]